MRVSTRSQTTPLVSILLLACLFGGPTLAAEQKRKAVPATSESKLAAPVPIFSPTPGFAVKPSDIVLPTDVPMGQYRRIIRPFPNWTLICDENLKKKQKVCNVTQAIIGTHGSTAFSWSLAASREGQPFFILRVPPGVGESGAVKLDLGDGGPVVSVAVRGCDQTVCIAYLQVGPRLRAAVGKKLTIEISYTSGSPKDTVAFRVPLDGLDAALAGI